MSADAPPLTIGFLGVQRRGSDPRALAGAFRSLGHCLVERSFDDYLPQSWRHPALKAARRLLRPLYTADYNRSVLELLESPLDFLLVFKGMLLQPGTLRRFHEAGVPCYLFYPDVSFSDHGTGIPACLPLYERIFTTKSFHLETPPAGISRERFLLTNHGADPEVHRPVGLPPRAREAFACDVSFVGCWSPKKEHHLSALVSAIPGLDLRIWGPGWNRSDHPVRSAWRGRGAWGDELAMIHSASRINLGLLSEAGGGTSSGDRTTARTWQIPASGGFLLHEATDEFAAAFLPGKEAAVFESPEDLIAQVVHYLANPDEREALRLAGLDRHRKAGYTYLPAAEHIVAYHQEAHAAGSAK